MNFDEPISRIGTHSMKWDNMQTLYGVDPVDGLSMWVADMDFHPPASVTQALQERLDHNVFGYFVDTSEYDEAMTQWVKTRHGYNLPEYRVIVHGLVQGISLCINSFTQPGDGVIIFSPVYHAFARTIKATGRDLIESALVNDDGQYKMDLDTLESTLKGHERMILLCSPHNPGGRVWSQSELNALADFAHRHDLMIISDEIHMDLVFGNTKHQILGKAAPQIKDRLVYLMSGTKSFNIAGALTGSVISENPDHHQKLVATAMAMGIGPNLFGMIACTAAYQGGHQWMDECVEYIAENARILDQGLAQIPGVVSMELSATYLSWVDFRALGLSENELHDRIQKTAQIAANHGGSFGQGGQGFMRFNIATTRANVISAVERMQLAFADIQ